ncbi:MULTISPECIES: RDD family protein [Streptomyces]|uniref:RDD family protein n=1 Tax=Streptomyces TaxID=1883 RepID=UPI0022498101|nr:RDD family protein [Streptomyces sp. JHD 1]MCX2971452.1 RDD family protein [Streptomyces sp. JHD 1]
MSGVDPASRPPPAARGTRLLARLVDAVLVAVPVFVASALLLEPWAITPQDPHAARSGATYDASAFTQTVLVALAFFGYEGLMLASRGRTVGKLAFGLRVVRLDDGAAPRGHPAWLRAAVFALPPLVPFLGALFWTLNALWCLGDGNRRCLHDRVSRTVVVTCSPAPARRSAPRGGGG